MAEQRVQRRLAAILAADVVGYSRLMDEDDATTANRLTIPWYRHDRRRQKLLDGRKNDFDSRSIVSEGLIWGIPD